MIYRVIALLFPLFARAFVDQNGDFQVWSRCEFWNYFSPKGFCLTEAEARWGDNASKLFLTFIQAQIAYQPVPWFYVAPGYRQQYQRFPVTSNHWEPNYIPLIDATFFWPVTWTLSNRNRLMYSIIDSDPSHWIYRNRLRFIIPWSFAYSRINPFIENEIFIRQRYGFNQDRLAGGFMVSLNDYLVARLYYMRRFTKTLDSHWIHQNILYITFVGNF